MTAVLSSVFAGGAVRLAQDQCGPFTDVSLALCPYVLEMYYLGITAGTSPTTYSPDNTMTRGQAAVFVSKGVNQALSRSSRRAALGQWWTTTPHYAIGLGVTGDAYGQIACDGANVWVGSSGGVSRVLASDGRALETWSGPGGGALVSAMGRIFIAADSTPGQVFMIDPSQPVGKAVLVADDLGAQPQSIAFDGAKLWTASRDGSISIIEPGATTPWLSTTLTPGFKEALGLVFDGSNMWVTDPPVGKIHKLDSQGGILASYAVGDGVQYPIFDGENIWVPNCCGVALVRPASGASVAYLQDPGTSAPQRVAFDGQRALVLSGNTDVVSLWNAATLERIQTTSLGTGATPQGVCSDGINFWVTLGNGELARY